MQDAKQPQSPAHYKTAYLSDLQGVRYRFQVLHARLQPRGHDLVYAYVNHRNQVGYIGSTEDAALRFPHERLDEALRWGATRLWVSRPIYRPPIPLRDAERRLIEAYDPPLNSATFVPALTPSIPVASSAPSSSEPGPQVARGLAVSRLSRVPVAGEGGDARRRPSTEKVGNASRGAGSGALTSPRLPNKFLLADGEVALQTLERIARAFDQYRRQQ